MIRDATARALELAVRALLAPSVLASRWLLPAAPIAEIANDLPSIGRSPVVAAKIVLDEIFLMSEVLLARFECQNREAVTFDDVPELVWQATVASEDRTFWENNGVDFQGVVRAALANLEAGEIVQGASTITQQVIDYARVLQEEGISEVDPEATPDPIMPIALAAPLERSITRPLMNGPRSLMVTMTLRPVPLSNKWLRMRRTLTSQSQLVGRREHELAAVDRDILTCRVAAASLARKSARPATCSGSQPAALGSIICPVS